MQAQIELSEEQMALLDEASEAEGVPRDEVVGRAVQAYLEGRRPVVAKPKRNGIDEAFGLWKDRAEDGLAYQLRMRSEWPD